MKTMYLIRHGLIENPKQVLYGRSIDLLLSSEGGKQIQALAKKMKSTREKIEAIYTSPLTRAKQTAQIIADEFDIKEFIVEEKFTEVDIPAVVGKPTTIVVDLHKKQKDEYEGEFAEQGNETRAEIGERVYSAWKKILHEEKKENVAIISHGDPLRFLLCKILHPEEKEIPPVWSLPTEYFLRRGEVLRLVVDDVGKVLDQKRIEV